MRFGYRNSILIGCAVIAMVTPGAALAATPSTPGTAARVVQTLQRLNPEALATAADAGFGAEGANALSTTASGATVTIPRDAASGITVSGKGIELGLPFAAQAQRAQPVTNGVVSYDNRNGTTTVPIAQNDGSVQIDTIIADASAPKEFAYPVTVPSGASLTPDRDGGVDILDSAGGWIAGFAPAWAKDGDGKPVATHYEVTGNTLTQVVDTAPTTVYPVVADPWLGMTIVDHVKWENVSKWSPTLAVFPTTFGRYWAPNAAEGAAWDEVKAKGGGQANTPTMQVQFDCHWYAVRVYAPRKPSWDLDSKRPNTSLVNEINYKCNFPDGGEEW